MQAPPPNPDPNSNARSLAKGKAAAAERVPRLAPPALALAISGVAFTCLAAFPCLAPAESDETKAGALSLQQALGKALANNKELAAFEYRLEEQAGRLRQAGLAPNPELSLVVEDAVGSGPYSGFESAQTTISLAWVLERKTRARRVGAARSSSELLVSDAEILRLEVGAETAQRFLSSLANQARWLNAGEEVSLAEETVAALRRRVAAGRAPSGELSRAEAELAMAALARDDVAHELAIAYHRLSAQWGEVEPDFSSVSGELLALPEIEPFSDFKVRAGIDRNPQLMRLASQERVARAKLELAESRRWPSLRPSLGLRHYADTSDVALVGELQIALPVSNRNQGQLSEFRAALARNRADTDAARVRVHAALFELYEELEHHLHRAHAFRDEVIPRFSEAHEQTRRGYERGRYSYFEWRSVQADLLDARRELIEASIGAHRLVIALESLSGERVATPRARGLE